MLEKQTSEAQNACMSESKTLGTQSINRALEVYEKGDWYWLEVVPPLTTDEIRDLPRIVCSKGVEHAPYVSTTGEDDENEDAKTTIAYSGELFPTDKTLETLVITIAKNLGTVSMNIIEK